jgi:uncharacterized protein (TIGR00369 family)
MRPDSPRDNPDRALIERILREGATDVPVLANPLAIDLGMRVMKAEPGRVTVRYAPGPRFLQGAGMIQGGIVATMLDFPMAFAIFTRLAPGESVSSVSLNVHFMRAAPAGECEAEGVLEKVGSRTRVRCCARRAAS